MLVQNSVYRNTYLTDGVNKDFYFSFPILEASQVLVQTSAVTDTETVTTVDPGQYTVTGVGLTTGGHISFNTAPPTGSRIALTLNIPITQLYQYAELDSFPAKSHEDALAKLTLICQQLKEQISRAVLISATSEQTSAELIALLLNAKDDAATSAAESLASATNAALSASNANVAAQDAATSAALAAANSEDLVVEVQNIANMLIGKANLDMDNLTPVGTTALAYYAKPSSRTISLSLQPSPFDIIAPGNGTITVRGGASGAGQNCGLYNIASGVGRVYVAPFPQVVSIDIPCKKDDLIRIAHDLRGTFEFFKFVYDEGAY